jgi:putative multiple sugar transport system permease protein
MGSIMSTDTAAPTSAPPRRRRSDAIKANLREYGLIIALIAIMLFFQFTTSGVLFRR